MSVRPVGHPDLVVTDLEHSLEFYNDLLKSVFFYDADGIKLEIVHRP